MQVVSKYVEDPVLFSRDDVGPVKFDIRYVVLLRSVRPLRLFVYDVFWLRFSNRCVGQGGPWESHLRPRTQSSWVSPSPPHLTTAICLSVRPTQALLARRPGRLREAFHSHEL